jgi:EAL domain-containing protein (putative c-di-GMP-specific phosphodiesterase class I)
MFRSSMLATSSPTTATKKAVVDDQAAKFAQRITAALPVMYARWLSLHDARGDVHWQSGDVLGPSERDGIRAALEAFGGDGAPARVNHALVAERTAVLLRSTDIFADFTGFVMLVVDNKQLRGKGISAKDLPVPVLRAARDWGAALARDELGSDERIAASALDDPIAEEFQGDDASGLNALPLVLYAQRLTPIQSGTRIRRYEVFMRLAGSDNWNTAPDAILREAEEKSLGHLIDRRMVIDLVEWLTKRREIWRTEPAQFSINTSSTTLHDPHFPEFVAAILRKANLPPGLVAFELDEALCRRHPQRCQHLANLLEHAGAGVVIDGFSLHAESVSLLMLPGLRLVKLDRDLSGKVLNDRAGQAQVAGLAHMARVAGVHSVAKKIEREDEHVLLRALGVDFAQGFATEMPAPLDAIDIERSQKLLIDPMVEALAANADSFP